jgi:hypothetical protein
MHVMSDSPSRILQHRIQMPHTRPILVLRGFFTKVVQVHLQFVWDPSLWSASFVGRLGKAISPSAGRLWLLLWGPKEGVWASALRSACRSPLQTLIEWVLWRLVSLRHHASSTLDCNGDNMNHSYSGPIFTYAYRHCGEV